AEDGIRVFHVTGVQTCALPILFGLSQAPAFTADEIIQKSEDRMKGETSYSEVTVTTVRPKYTREMTIKTWTKGDDYSVTLILSRSEERRVGKVSSSEWGPRSVR